MDDPFVGRWICRSFRNDGEISTRFDDLEFGRAMIEILGGPLVLRGTITGIGWSLELKGSCEYGTPMRVRFQGVGEVDGSKWVYDYEGWLIPSWPSGVYQKPVIVGSLIRSVPHPGAEPGSIAVAGVVYSFYAVKIDSTY